MKILLSVLVPGIHPDNWQTLYDSVGSACKYNWEIIFISPYDLPEEMKNLKNVKHIKDWGTPIKCQQRGLLAAKGDWVTWAADDGKFLPNSINISFEKLTGRDINDRTLVMGKYFEGLGDNQHMMGTDYYILSRHKASFSPWLPAHYLMLNVGIVTRKLLLSVGGWDCQFEVCPMAYNDLAVRLQNYGCKFIVQDEMMFMCGHTPLDQGDHGPIHFAQTEHDEPLFKEIYGVQKSIDRVRVSLDTWQDCPDKWERRFGTKEFNYR